MCTGQLRLIFLILTLLIPFSLSAGPSKWQLVHNGVINVATDARDQVFAISLNKQLLRYNPRTDQMEVYASLPRAGVDVAISTAGQPWVTTSSNLVYQWEPARKNWKQVAVYGSAIAIGPAGHKCVVNPNAQKIYYYSPQGGKWRVLRTTGRAIEGKKPTDVAVSRYGDLYVIFEDHSIFYFNISKRSWTQLPGKGLNIALNNTSKGHDRQTLMCIGISKRMFRWQASSSNWETKSTWAHSTALRNIASLTGRSVWVVDKMGRLYRRIEWADTNFRPSRHGFQFPNSFKVDKKIRFKTGPFDLIVPPESRTLSINQGYGLCGGMALGAYEYWKQGRPIPTRTQAPTENTQLFSYLWDRLLRSLGGTPRGKIPYRYAIEIANWWAEPKGKLELPKRSVIQLGHIKQRLTQGEPVQLMLVYHTNLSTKAKQALWDNHQVLAYRFEDHAHGGKIFIYDPNQPGNDRMYLGYEKTERGLLIYEHGFTHRGSKRVYGFFDTKPTLN